LACGFGGPFGPALEDLLDVLADPAGDRADDLVFTASARACRKSIEAWRWTLYERHSSQNAKAKKGRATSQYL
jgi:hypothetical protein